MAFCGTPRGGNTVLYQQFSSPKIQSLAPQGKEEFSLVFERERKEKKLIPSERLNSYAYIKTLISDLVWEKKARFAHVY